MQKNGKEKSRQDQEVAGEEPKMSKSEPASYNLNTPTSEATQSLLTNGNEFNLTLFEMEEKESSSSTSNNTIYDLSSHRKPDPEMDREGTLIIHFTSYGRGAQSERTAEAMVKDLQVKGYNILEAIHNQQPLDFDNKWSEPVIGGPEEPIDL